MQLGSTLSINDRLLFIHRWLLLQVSKYIIFFCLLCMCLLFSLGIGVHLSCFFFFFFFFLQHQSYYFEVQEVNFYFSLIVFCKTDWNSRRNIKWTNSHVWHYQAINRASSWKQFSFPSSSLYCLNCLYSHASPVNFLATK